MGSNPIPAIWAEKVSSTTIGVKQTNFITCPFFCMNTSIKYRFKDSSQIKTEVMREGKGHDGIISRDYYVDYYQKIAKEFGTNWRDRVICSWNKAGRMDHLLGWEPKKNGRPDVY